MTRDPEPRDRQTSDDPWGIGDYDLARYLDTVGVTPGAAGPDTDLLDALCSAHVHTFPFANVDVLLGTHPGVAPADVDAQLVARHRGGYCFEHAQLFAAVAERLGFTVRRALGRVHAPGSRRTHMTVKVHLHGRWWLCDPGFGFSMTGPIELADGAERREPDRSYSVHRFDDDGSALWELRRDGDTLHFTDDLTVHPADVAAGHFVTSRSPGSHFTAALTVARSTGDGHVTVTDTHRTVRFPGRATTRDELDPGDVPAAVESLGVVLVGDEPERLAAHAAAARTDP